MPWRIRTKWKNALVISSKMVFKVSCIYREGNECADKLVNFGVDSKCYS